MVGSDHDRGAVVIIVAAAIGAMLVMVAMVLDHSGARRDAEADQLAADAMALAAAQSLTGATPAVSACNAAVDYVTVNLPTAEVAPAPSCATAFSGSCSSSTPARTLGFTVGEYRFTFTHPVPDGHALLAGQAQSTLDGTRCQRFGVRVEQERANLWAAGSVDLTRDAVGRHLPGAGEVTAPLILLNQQACGVLSVGGSSKLKVRTASGGKGYVAIDSSGADCPENGNKLVLDVKVDPDDPQGKIEADAIAIYAITAGRAGIAHDPDLLDPRPVGPSARVGRTAMDWRYDCDPSGGCPGSGPAYITQVKSLWGGAGNPPTIGWLDPEGYGAFRSFAGTYGCSVGTLAVPAGNWYLDCAAGVSVSGTLTFQGGNIVADKPPSLTGSARLRVNCADPNVLDAIAPVSCESDPAEFSPATFFLRSGDLLDNRPMELRQTFVYLSAGTVKLSGNAALTWTAPDDPAYPFDDLLMWTESTDLMKITGTPDLVLEGTLFAPKATLELAGNASTTALGAQILVDRASLGGDALLDLAPDEDRITKVGKGKPLLIR